MTVRYFETTNLDDPNRKGLLRIVPEPSNFQRGYLFNRFSLQWEESGNVFGWTDGRGDLRGFPITKKQAMKLLREFGGIPDEADTGPA